MAHPTTCFFPSSTCSSSIRGLFYTKQNFDNIKIPLIIGQLVAGALMFILCLVYILIYILTVLRVRKANTATSIYPQAADTFPNVPTGPDGYITAPPVTNVRALRAASPLYHRPTAGVSTAGDRPHDLQCPNCNSTMIVSVTKTQPQ